MKLLIKLHQYGIAGKIINGNIVVTLSKPIFLQRAFVQLEQVDRKYLCDKFEYPCDETHHQVFPQTNASLNTIEINMFECGGFQSDTITEFGPGTYYLPFEFTLPSDFPPILQIQNKSYGMSYMLTAIVFEANGKKYCSSPTPFPIFYNCEIPNPLPLTTTKPLGKMIIVLTQDHLSYCQGDTINIRLSIFPYPTTTSLVISLISCYNESTVCLKDIYNSLTVTLKTNAPLCDMPIAIPITYSTPPSVNTTTNSFNYYISISTLEKSTESLASFPVKIIAHQPPPQDQQLELTKLNQLSNTFYDGHLEPPPPFPSTSINGFEMINTTSGILYLNHIHRTVHDNPSSQPLQIPYPLFQSITLHPGFSYGLYHNQLTLIDHNTQTVTWAPTVDPPPSTLTNSSATPIVTIIVVSARGLASRFDGKPPCAYCLVQESLTNMTRSKEVKSFDPTFNAVFYIYPPPSRHNIVVSIFDKRQLGADDFLGSVEINLSRFSFPSFISSWFHLHNSPHGDDGVTGKIFMKVGYSNHPYSNEDIAQQLIEFSSCSIVPYIPPTEKSKNQAMIQNKIRSKNGDIPAFHFINDSLIIPTDYCVSDLM
ncbi:C2 domain-containing protein [Entamoeba marina]